MKITVNPNKNNNSYLFDIFIRHPCDFFYTSQWFAWSFCRSLDAFAIRPCRTATVPVDVLPRRLPTYFMNIWRPIYYLLKIEPNFLIPSPNPFKSSRSTSLAKLSIKLPIPPGVATPLLFDRTAFINAIFQELSLRLLMDCNARPVSIASLTKLPYAVGRILIGPEIRFNYIQYN